MRDGLVQTICGINYDFGAHFRSPALGATEMFECTRITALSVIVLGNL